MVLFDLDVFINAPFDGTYRPIFRAIVFTVVRYGYRVRCALEADNAADNRLDKTCDIIAECKLSVHDISPIKTDDKLPLPRFNMPLELGLFLGARRYGSGIQKTKACIVLDREQYRYRKFISDLSGVDIHAHNGKPKDAVKEVASWLRSLPGGTTPGGGSHVWSEYRVFCKEMKEACAANNIQVAELTFPDYHNLVVQHVATL